MRHPPLTRHFPGRWDPGFNPNNVGVETHKSESSPKSQGGAGVKRGPCFLCRQMGHYWREYPMMECDIGWEVHPTGRAKADRNLPSHCLDHRLVTVLLDTRSSISMIRAHLVPEDRPPL